MRCKTYFAGIALNRCARSEKKMRNDEGPTPNPHPPSHARKLNDQAYHFI